MLGAIAGDIVGSVHEFEGTKTKDFPLFVAKSRWTDDSVLAIAVARWLLEGGDLVDLFHDAFASHPYAGYGMKFRHWASARSREPYGSWGNGSAMRVSPVGFAFQTLDETLAAARATAAVTHDHPDGIRGAEATAAAIYLARNTKDRDEIRSALEADFGYDLSTPLDAIRPTYVFDESCAGTVPQALRCFLESTDFEDTLRNAISLGGDADTLACIAGGVAEAYYDGVPDAITRVALARLEPGLRDVVLAFRRRHGLSRRIAAAGENDRSIVRQMIDELSAWDAAETARLGFDPALMESFYYKHEALAGFDPPGGAILLASVDGEPAGCAAFRPLADGVCEMKHVWVRPRFRGHGVARALVERLLAEARRAGYELMRLESAAFMADAHRLYEALGFERRPPYYAIPEVFLPITVFMERRLA